MAGRLRTIAIVIGVLAIMVLGLIFLKGPTPHIEIKGEVLWAIGPLDITNTLFTAWIVVFVLCAGAFLSTRKLSIIPGRWQSLLDGLVEAILDLVVATAGERHARRFFPVIATLFIFIIAANWFALFPFFNAIGKFEPIGVEDEEFFEDAVLFEEGPGGTALVFPNATELEFEIDEAACEGSEGEAHEACLEELHGAAIEHGLEEEEVAPAEVGNVGILAPYFRSVNTDLMSPLSLAIVSAIFVEFWGITALGFFAYGSKFVNVGRLRRGDPMGIIDVFVGVLEFIAEIARLISFSFRLFGNMLAGEILLLVMTFLVPLFLALPFYGLELFVGGIQAFVFAMLTLVFGTLAVTAHGDDGHEQETQATAAEEAAAAHQGG